MEFNSNPVQIGWYILPKDKEYSDRGYECAAWYEDYLVPVGKYPIYGNWNRNEKERCYENRIAYRNISVTLKGTVVRSDFSSHFYGVPVGSKIDQNVGEEVIKTLSFYNFTLIGWLEGEQPDRGFEVELLDGFSIEERSFKDFRGEPCTTKSIVYTTE